jgi:hypothetical protein
VLVADPFVSTSGIYLGNGDGTLQSSSGPNGALPNLSIAVPVGGATVALQLTGARPPSVISGNTELRSLSAAAASTSGFALALSSTSGTASAGQSAQTTVTLTPNGGFDQSVALSCSGLPTGATCSFSSPTVSVNGAATSSTLTISTTAATAMNSKPWSPAPLNPLMPGGVALAGAGAPLLLRRRGRGLPRPGRAVALMLLALGTALLLQACGGGGSGSAGGGTVAGATPSGVYPVTVAATGGAATQTITYTLTVQ